MDEIYSPDGAVDKNALWRKYGRLVRQEALKLKARLPASIELDDLIQAGSIGLLNAIDQFDPKKGVALGIYLTQRLRWALIDELRNHDWVPRRVRSNSRKIAAAIVQVEQRSGRDATEAEIATELGVPLQDYQQMLADTNTSQLYSLDELLEAQREGGEQIDLPQEQLNPLIDVLAKDLVQQISNEIKFLPKREQLLLNLYYQQELNMKEIGVLLGITETRVSQLHSQTIKRIRARLSSEKERVK
ncbi:RNA polymerase sigma factor FliA [Enterobacter pasteurii]|uniref:RNA polymerase sigma factor FliA n=1 Tax=Enterobacter pasteurii TaxID=3029761 RepID=UPI0011DD3D4C|nr:RNA polymerase sigma factor FliA [Enterobacter pasteurii]QLA70377.1 RNA polymerase sigma factor FliA [Enterobacter pasteurii]